MVVRNITQAKAELSALLELVQEGEEVIVAKAGKPVARIVPYRGAAAQRVPGLLDGQIRIAPDFDELPEDITQATRESLTLRTVDELLAEYGDAVEVLPRG